MRSLIPWRDSHLMEEARREFDDMFRRWFGGAEPASSFGVTTWTPHIDVSENDKQVVVKADVPGVDPKQIDITVQDGMLTIKGEKREEREDKQENFHRMERFAGQFYRTLQLPTGIDEDKVTAHTTKGVITITIPKKGGTHAKKVNVKVSE